MDDCILQNYLSDSLDPQEVDIISPGESELHDDRYLLYGDGTEPAEERKELMRISFGRLQIDPSRAEKNYEKSICLPFVVFPDASKSHFRRVFFDGITAGYLVPVEDFEQFYHEDQDLFDDEEELSDMEEQFREAALVGLLKNPDCIEFSVFSIGRGQLNFRINDFYTKDVAVLVLNKENMDETYYNGDRLEESIENEIAFQMISQGYSAKYYLDDSRFLAQFDWNENGTSIKFERIAEALRNYLPEILDLANEASISNSAPVVFFLLYQILESVSFVVFDALLETVISRIKTIIEDIECLSNPTDYESKIDRIDGKTTRSMTHTRGRLKHLVHFESTRNSDLYAELDVVSADLHQCIERHIRSDLSYTCQPSSQDILDSTVSVRNHVVHSQSRWRTNKDLLDKLWTVNRKLLLVIHDILKKFDKDGGIERFAQSLVAE